MVCRSEAEAAPNGCGIAWFDAMPLKSKRSPAEGEFLFEIDERPTEECLTALAACRCSPEQTGSQLEISSYGRRGRVVKRGEGQGPWESGLDFDCRGA